MLHNQKRVARLLTTSLAIAALAPAAAAAAPILDGHSVVVGGQSVAAGGGSAVTPQTLVAPDQVDRAVTSKQDLRAPDQVDGSVVGTQSANPPQWPVNPQPIGHTGTKATAPSSDDGLSTEVIVLIAIGGAALVATAGLGLAYRKRTAARQRQLA
jgi:hypothetical protein